MKRLLPLLYIVPLLLCLSGCGSSILEADRHDIERLLLIQTMGLDAQGSGVEMSVSSGLGPEDSPALVMSTAAAGIEDAIARLQNYSPENQLFYAHVQYLLLGEEAARRDLPTVLEWVDRSPTLRMDTDMVIVRGRARDAVVDASQGSTDITERLASLGREAHTTGWTIHTLREIAAELAEDRGALCLAVQTVPTKDTVFTEDKGANAVIPMGYAVLNQQGLLGFLSPEASLGAELLTGDATGILFSVAGNTMEVLNGSADVSGQWSEDGRLEGITVACSLQTGILEQAQDKDPSPEDLDRLLSETVAGWLTQTLERAQSWSCDFLHLEQSVLKTQKQRAAAGDWAQTLSSLPVTISVDGIVDRSYDLAE